MHPEACLIPLAGVGFILLFGLGIAILAGVLDAVMEIITHPEEY